MEKRRLKSQLRRLAVVVVSVIVATQVLGVACLSCVLSQVVSGVSQVHLCNVKDLPRQGAVLILAALPVWALE